MIRSFKRIAGALVIVSLFLLCRPANAAGTAQLVFVMPTGVDPVNLTFTANGQTLSFFGRDTIDEDPQNPNNPFGVEFRSGNPSLLFHRFDIAPGQGRFDGYLGITPTIDALYAGYFTKEWTSTEPFTTARLDWQPGAAYVGEPDPTNPVNIPLHSILQYQGGLEGSDLEAFKAQEFLVTAYAVPEPGVGTMAIVSGALSVGWIVRRRRRR